MVGTRKKIRVTEVDEFTELERGLRFDLMIELCSIHRGSFRSYLDLGYIYIYMYHEIFFEKFHRISLFPPPLPVNRKNLEQVGSFVFEFYCADCRSDLSAAPKVSSSLKMYSRGTFNAC